MDAWDNYDNWKLESPYDNEDQESCEDCGEEKCKCKEYLRADYERDLKKDREFEDE